MKGSSNNMIAKSLILALPLLLSTIAQANAACNASLVQNLVGTTATFNTVNSAIQTAGAGNARVIEESNPIMTKDLNRDRLTIFTDLNNKIKSLSCN
jgi:hypothetical protein